MMARGGPRFWSCCGQVLALLLLVLESASAGWKVEYMPKRRLSVLEDSDVVRFVGETSSPDFASILLDGDSIFVGARNVFYKLNGSTLRTIKKFAWSADEVSKETCLTGFQKTQFECQNYIRVMTRWSNLEIMICGTNAVRPICRIYKNSPHYDLISSRSGVAISPYGPHDSHSFTAIGQTIFSATYTDMSSTDPLISNGRIRTEPDVDNVRWFNEPKFVSSFEYGDKVFFFFRETARERENCGKTVYSRVARVCKKDTGGRTILRERFTSFLKTRLNCSVPGIQNFNFDEIVDTSMVGRGNIRPIPHSRDAQDIVYGLFNTPGLSITAGAGAICAFRLSDVAAAFKSRVMEQPTPNSYWKPKDSAYVELDECADDSENLPDARNNFVRSRQLMEEPVSAFGSGPLYIQTELEARMTKLTVDWQVPASDGHYYDILFIGTDDGRILKMYNKDDKLYKSAVTVEEIQVSNTAIVDLKILAIKEGEKTLLVTSKNSISRLPLHRCETRRSCAECVALQDPYCSWLPGQGCKNSRNGYQSLATGRHSRCPSVTTKPTEAPSTKPTADCTKCVKCPTTTTGNNNNNNNNEIPRTGGGLQPQTGPGSVKNNTIDKNLIKMGASTTLPEKQISLFTFLLSLVASSIVTALLFFSLGYCIAYKRGKAQNSNIKYLDKLSDTSERAKRVNTSNYVQAPGPKTLNVLMNVAPKTQNKYTVPSPVPEHKIVHMPPVPDHKCIDKGILSPARKAYV